MFAAQGLIVAEVFHILIHRTCHFFEYACVTAKIASNQGISNVFVTNSFMTSEATPPAVRKKAYSLGQADGLLHIYIGNIDGDPLSTL
ncbi:MAG TPA: hypothetical protein PKV75_11070 [Desulfobacterales bacterium]|nr:hypothetical protein [Desulfobacterales bacterium]